MARWHSEHSDGDLQGASGAGAGLANKGGRRVTSAHSGSARRGSEGSPPAVRLRPTVADCQRAAGEETGVRRGKLRQRDGGSRRFRRGRRRRGFRRPLHAPPAARPRATARVFEAGTASAGPGTGTAIRARAATSRAGVLVLSSPRSCSRSGTGASATRRSRRSCATSTTSPTASTCAATSSSTRASARRTSTRRRAAGGETTDGDEVSARFCIMATGCLSAANMPRFEGLERFAGRATTPAAGRTRRSTSPASASA